MSHSKSCHRGVTTPPRTRPRSGPSRIPPYCACVLRSGRAFRDPSRARLSRDRRCRRRRAAGPRSDGVGPTLPSPPAGAPRHLLVGSVALDARRRRRRRMGGEGRGESVCPAERLRGQGREGVGVKQLLRYIRRQRQGRAEETVFREVSKRATLGQLPGDQLSRSAQIYQS